MDLGISGNVAIVTGGSKGIGKAIAQELSRRYGFGVNASTWPAAAVPGFRFFRRLL